MQNLKSIFHFLGCFYPIQIVFGHLKYNLFAILIWIFFFLIITDNLGYYFGIPILFYSPEYLGEVSSISFALLGFGFGGFVMAFNTYSYVKLGKRYPFLMVVHRPFFKFCQNNLIIPVSFLIVYLINMSRFQMEQEYATWGDVIWFSISFIFGVLFFMTLSILYFFPMSRKNTVQHSNDDTEEQPVESVILKQYGRWYHRNAQKFDKTYIYLGKKFKFTRSRKVSHLDDETVDKVLMRNRINSSIFEIISILAFVILGLFSEFTIFETPAAMSIVLLITLLLMLYSSLQSWFRKWTSLILIGTILFMNFLSVHTPYFTFKNYAYGLNYDLDKRPEYSIAEIEKNAKQEIETKKSQEEYIKILEEWKKKTGEKRPKLIIVNCSGGGSRSALWTFQTLQNLDKELNGQLKEHIQLITGASGGMVGAAYFRELILRKHKDEISSIYNDVYRVNLAKDLLNKLSFSASTRDMFFRYQKYDYNGKSYSKDRGYAFEEQLHENTNYFMDHSLGYYDHYEENAVIPTMIFTPTIVNDGRRLLISSQSVCFLTSNNSGPARQSKSYENVDFQTFFKHQDPQHVRFSSVMRSSATFPFVMPMVTMPSNPEMQLMDAGIRDNYGGKITMEFLNELKDWIAKNTSGVIILQIRDTKKVLDNEAYRQVSFLDKLSMPFGNMYSNFPRTQDFDQEELFKVGTQQFVFPVDMITFNLREDKNERISLSWHLTSQEKVKIEQAFKSSLNQQSLSQLKRLMNK